MTENFRRIVLYVDAVFLMVLGGIQATFEIIGYAWGIGPLGDIFHESSYTIGFVEAHGFAFLMGAVLLAAARRADRHGNALGLAVHVLLAVANLSFWASYSDFGIVPAGVASTAAHIVFVLVHTLCLAVPSRQPALR